MSNEEQLAILEQGVDVWNKWREENSDVEIDFFKARLRRLHLASVDFREVNLMGADLNFTNLVCANLSEANLFSANLNGTNLSGANLNGVDFSGANLNGVKLKETQLAKGRFAFTMLGDNDLSSSIGLETIEHYMPSSIGIDTIQKSKGKIPVEFLRGCGLSDLDIEYAKLANPELCNEEISEITQNIFDLKATLPIQISPLFISYSHANTRFVEELEGKLLESGIRFWRDVHDATAGRLETQIDRAIRHNPTVLLILSENSTKSDWVEHEVRLARKLEKEMGRDVLCPVALDDSWKTSRWPERIMEQVMEYNILDFSKWDDDKKFDEMFTKLIDGLDMFYKK